MRRIPLGRGLVAAAALVLLGAGANLAAPVPQLPVSADRVLQLALGAPRLIDYEGTKIITVLRNGHVETVTAAEFHKRPNMTRLEYLSPEDVAGRLIVDDGVTGWHYEPRLNMAFDGPTMDGGLLHGDLSLLHRNYRVTGLGIEEVIGRQAYVVLLEPNGPGVSRELWVDQATGTVLRTEERDPSRGVVLTTYFSRISFSLNLPAAYFRFRLPAGARVFQMITKSGESASPETLARQAGFGVLVPPVLPEGYTFSGGAISRFGSLTSVYLRYSDGETLLSLFEAPAGSIGAPAFGQQVRVGGQPGRFVDLGYFRVLIWEQRGLHLTAVGTVPTDTLMAIAGQLVSGQEQALVHTVSEKVAVDPETVSRLRSQGLTFTEIARAVMLSQALQVDVPTAVRFLQGRLPAAQLARDLGVTPDALQQTVQGALDRASSVGPHLTAPGR
ncbi:MAG TPA: sigma-E factor regulatory protein RseB domain-containing protein [bacterium]|nr:sigma-E factor regulatory protein RseB domain-containing protein [bacterium]